MRELVPSDIITEKLSRDGSLKVTEVEVEEALESMLTCCHVRQTLHSTEFINYRHGVIFVLSCIDSSQGCLFSCLHLFSLEN